GSTSNGSFARSVWSRRRASIALRRAAVVSHAPGLSGTPTRFHASSADTYASCTHSSARSISHATRAVAASTYAHSRRCASATASATSASRFWNTTSPDRSCGWLFRSATDYSLEDHDRPNLDAPEGCRAELADLECLVKVLCLDEVEAAERL